MNRTKVPAESSADSLQGADPEVDDLYAATYEELRRLAGVVKQGDGSETLNPTALVHEAYLKLCSSLKIEASSRQHFKRLAVRAMRQVLVEAARSRLAQKRGAGQALVTFDEALLPSEAVPEQILAISQLISVLGTGHPRPQQVVELRYFGGFSTGEIAEILGVSPSSVDRDWRFAKAWLKVRLKPQSSGANSPSDTGGDRDV